MNKSHYLLLFILPFLFLACDKSNIEYENDFEKSYQTWLNFKTSHNDSYRYVVNGSSWAGYAWQTVLIVQAGEVTERTFHYTVYNDYRIPEAGWSLETTQEMLDSLSRRYQVNIERLPSADSIFRTLIWNENKSNLNDPVHGGGAPTWTLDQVYEQAKNDWLRKRDNAHTSFEAKNNGLISSCGYWEDGCMDDCFRGIRISGIEGGE